MCDKIVIGIDVAKEFSYCSIALPSCRPQKAFRVNHCLKDFSLLLTKIRELETHYNTSTVMIAESTGHYSDLPANFFRNHSIEFRLINPILTASIKNIDVRKIQNDKIEAVRIADLYLLGKTDQTKFSDAKTHRIKNLCRQYFDLSDDLTKHKNRLTSLVDQVFPKFNTVFSNIGSKGALFILEKFNTHNSVINSDRNQVVSLIKQISRRSNHWANSKYEALLAVAIESKNLFCPDYFGVSIVALITSLRCLQISLLAIKKEIETATSDIKEIQRIRSLPGCGPISAAVIYSEMRSFSNFTAAKQLVAFSGIDPAVSQSGTFNGTRMKMSKRGSSFLRRAWFTIALASIRTTRNGKYINKVLHDFYHEKCISKPKKVALVAVMHKLVHYTFAILKSDSDYVMTTKEEHKEHYEKSLSVKTKPSIPA